MARTKAAVSPQKRAQPVDLAALRERIKSIETRVSYTVPITLKIEARMYEAIVNACDKYDVKFAPMVRRVIAEGLEHLTEFVTPYDAPFERPQYRPGRGMSRGRNAYENLIDVTPPAREQRIESDDPLIAATLTMGQRAGAPRSGAVASSRKPSAVAAAIASSLDRDDEAEKETPADE